MQTKEVTVVLREEWSIFTPFVTVRWECPECGEPMGKPYGYNFYEDGDTYHCDRWENSCGHVATYRKVQIETTEGFISWEFAKSNGMFLSDFMQILKRR